MSIGQTVGQVTAPGLNAPGYYMTNNITDADWNTLLDKINNAYQANDYNSYKQAIADIDDWTSKANRTLTPQSYYTTIDKFRSDLVSKANALNTNTTAATTNAAITNTASTADLSKYTQAQINDLISKNQSNGSIDQQIADSQSKIAQYQAAIASIDAQTKQLVRATTPQSTYDQYDDSRNNLINSINSERSKITQLTTAKSTSGSGALTNNISNYYESGDIKNALSNTGMSNALDSLSTSDPNYASSIAALQNNLKYARGNTMQNVINAMKVNKTSGLSYDPYANNTNDFTGLEQASSQISNIKRQDGSTGKMTDANGNPLSDADEKNAVAAQSNGPARGPTGAPPTTGNSGSVGMTKPPANMGISKPQTNMGISKPQTNTAMDNTTQPVTTTQQPNTNTTTTNTNTGVQQNTQTAPAQNNTQQNTSIYQSNAQDAQAQIDALNLTPIAQRTPTWNYQMQIWQQKLQDSQNKMSGI